MSGEGHTAFKSHVMHNVYRLWLLTSFIQIWPVFMLLFNALCINLVWKEKCIFHDLMDGGDLNDRWFISQIRFVFLYTTSPATDVIVYRNLQLFLHCAPQWCTTWINPWNCWLVTVSIVCIVCVWSLWFDRLEAGSRNNEWLYRSRCRYW